MACCTLRFLAKQARVEELRAELDQIRIDISSAQSAREIEQKRLKKANQNVEAAERRYYGVRAKVDGALDSMMTKDGGDSRTGGATPMPAQWPRTEDGGCEEAKEEEPENVTKVLCCLSYSTRGSCSRSSGLVGLTIA